MILLKLRITFIHYRTSAEFLLNSIKTKNFFYPHLKHIRRVVNIILLKIRITFIRTTAHPQSFLHNSIKTKNYCTTAHPESYLHNSMKTKNYFHPHYRTALKLRITLSTSALPLSCSHNSIKTKNYFYPHYRTSAETFYINLLRLRIAFIHYR